MRSKNRANILWLSSLLPGLGCEDVAGPVSEIAESKEAVGAVWKDVGGSSWGIDSDVRLSSRPAPAGGISNTLNAHSYSPSLALDAFGNPVVAWSDDASGNFEIYVKRWNGTSWQELDGSASGGGVSRTSRASTEPSIAVDASDRPTVVWTEDLSDSENYYSRRIYLKRWNGERWEELGGSAGGNGISGTAEGAAKPSLALDSWGWPTVAWVSGGITEILLKRWNGAEWVELAGSGTGAGVSGTAAGWSMSPSLAVDSGDRPIVAWSESPRDYPVDPIYIRRWDGSSWTEIGAGSASGTGMSGPSRNAISPSLALSSTGNPVVSWCDDRLGNLNVYVSMWDGESWKELGGSAARKELNDPRITPYATSLAVDSGDRPAIVWYGANREVYAKRWTGTVWAEFGSGSASGGGVSNSEEWSLLPVLKIRGGVACVTWVETTYQWVTSEVLLRRIPEP